MKTLFSYVVLCLVALPIVAADRTEEHRCTFTEGMAITISNTAGTITVSTWDKDEIQLKARLEDRVEKLQVQCGERNLDIQVIIPRQGSRKISAYLDLFIPESHMASIDKLHIEAVSANIILGIGASDVSLESISGDISQSGPAEALDISTVSGSIRATGSATQATAESVSGDIQMDGDYHRAKVSSISGTLRLKGTADTATLGTTSGDIIIESATKDLDMGSVSGTIRATDCRGNIEGSTVSGDIIIKGDGLDDVELGSVSGTISIEGSLNDEGDLQAETKSGDIRLKVPVTTPLAVAAETHSGDISCDFPGASVKKDSHGPGSELEFDHEAATCDIELKSFSGAISLKRN